MRTVASLACFVVLAAPTRADLIVKPPSAKPPSAPSTPGPNTDTPGGHGPPPGLMGAGPTAAPRAESPSITAATTSPEAMASLMDIPVDDPADRPADSDPRKLIGAIALVLGVYAATRLLRRKPSDAKP